MEARVEVEREEELPAALAALGLGAPRPVLVVVGGAGSLAGAELDALVPCAEALVGAAAAAGAALVDGGTDAGVMRLAGRARAALGATLPLVGVVVRALVGNEARLEPRHTHFVLVPGTSWGDEAPWVARVATALAGTRPSLTVLLHGGEIAWADAAESVAAGRMVLAVAGSGGTADALAAAARGAADDPRAVALVRSGLVEPADVREDRTPTLEQKVREMLAARRTADAR